MYNMHSKPTLLGRLSGLNRNIEVWRTSCIVTNFGKTSESNCNVLVNPCNPELSGVSKFPYFPSSKRGGPVPRQPPKSMHKDWQPLGYVSQWGGMDVGDGMLYPVSVIDGIVHQVGGTKLAMECKYISLFYGGCPIGEAVKTFHGSAELIKSFDMIIHTSPPFFKYHNDPIKMLRQCYKSSLLYAFSENVTRKVAIPLIGAGCRGFPLETALKVAASETTVWKNNESSCLKDRCTIAFGLPDVSTCYHLLDLLEKE